MFVSTSEQDEKQTEPNELKSDIRVRVWLVQTEVYPTFGLVVMKFGKNIHVPLRKPLVITWPFI